MALGGTAPWDFVDCQWTVHVKCQYDAAKRVRRALKAQARDHALGKSPATPAQVSVSIPTTAVAGKGRALDMKALVQMAQERRERSEDAASAQDAAARGEQQRADLQLAVTVEQAANTARNLEKRGTPVQHDETNPNPGPGPSPSPGPRPRPRPTLSRHLHPNPTPNPTPPPTPNP